MVAPMVKTNILQIHTITQSSYQEVWDFQEILLQKLIQSKRKEIDLHNSVATHHLIFCEHQPVYTLGKSGSMDHLLLDDQALATHQFEFHKINRGGDITYHGSGQWTIYPIIDLESYARDVHKYVRNLELIIVDLLKEHEITGTPVTDFTGVWTGDNSDRKLCAIGVHLSRWVSMHGLALNVNANLDHFANIVPCGIPTDTRSVTSIAKETGNTVEMDLVKDQFIELFTQYYPMDTVVIR